MSVNAGSSSKILTGSGGAVLEDVPHLTDWLPDLPTYANPLKHNPAYSAVRQYFVENTDVVAKDVVVNLNTAGDGIHFRRAGPRDKIYFKPGEVKACIVTCGGLCPGLNTVIREIVCGLWTQYGVREIYGIHGGYRGFYSRNTTDLSPKVVNDIHKRGGTVLGTSRGGHDTSKIVDSIEDRGINQVYIIGGDGTQRGANVIHEECKRRGLKVVVAGIPKTIDNDIEIIDKSFGFDTAVEEAQRAINAAHVEAESIQNGVGLVKLMGRYSGYIAMHATLASRDVDLCLIPEVPFYMDGPGGLLEFAKQRLRENGHMVIVVAEGAGQELMAESMGSLDKLSDASGNRLLLDVGLWLCQHLKDHFVKEFKEPLNLKYIDPTYMIRAIPSNASDNVYCTLLAHSAIHGAMAGYCGFTVGPVNNRHCYIPISRVTATQRQVNIADRMWARLLSSTNQPDFLRYKKAMQELPRKEEEEEADVGLLDEEEFKEKIKDVARSKELSVDDDASGVSSIIDALIPLVVLQGQQDQTNFSAESPKVLVEQTKLGGDNGEIFEDNDEDDLTIARVQEDKETLQEDDAEDMEDEEEEEEADIDEDDEEEEEEEEEEENFNVLKGVMPVAKPSTDDEELIEEEEEEDDDVDDDDERDGEEEENETLFHTRNENVDETLPRIIARESKDDETEEEAIATGAGGAEPEIEDNNNQVESLADAVVLPSESGSNSVGNEEPNILQEPSREMKEDQVHIDDQIEKVPSGAWEGSEDHKETESDADVLVANEAPTGELSKEESDAPMIVSEAGIAQPEKIEEDVAAAPEESSNSEEDATQMAPINKEQVEPGKKDEEGVPEGALGEESDGLRAVDNRAPTESAINSEEPREEVKIEEDSSLSGIPGQISNDEDDDYDDDDDDDDEHRNLDAAKALAALVKSASGKTDPGSAKSNLPSLGAAGPSLPQRPVGRNRSATASEPTVRNPPRSNVANASQLSAPADENPSSGDGNDGSDETHEKLQNIRVKFLRLAHRLDQSPQNVVVAQVLYRLGLAEQLRGGRSASRAGAFSFDRANAIAEEQEASGQEEELDFVCTVLLLGKTGVGKSATINSIFDEPRTSTNAFHPSTKKVQEIIGNVHGIKVRVIDTPGLLPSVMDQQHNERIMGSVKQFIQKSSPDIVLYFDRLDMQSRDYGDLPLLRTITDVFGAAVWFNAIVVLTHASSAPPDGPNGVPLSYEMFVAQRSHVVQQTIRQAAGDMRLMNPVSLVENHPACRTNRAGERVLPNGQIWKPQLLLLCFASKILAEANSLLKLQDTSTPGRPFGQRPRVPPLPFLLSSLLQSRAQLKVPDEQQLGDEDDTDDDDDSADSDADDYDDLPPFRPLAKEELDELSKEQKQQYAEELADREMLFQKKQWREELQRRKEMKRRAMAMSQEELAQAEEVMDDDGGRAAAVPVPMPDMTLPPSFDSDNPTHRYRYLETANQWLVRPVLETHGWDHDAGYDGFNVEKLFVVAEKIPASISGQVTKDKKEAQVNFEAAASFKHGEDKTTLAGFDIQTIGKDLGYTVRSETQFSNFKKNKTTAGLTFTLLGDTVAAGLKLEDRLLVGKRLKMVVNGGVLTGRGDKAFGGSLEATLKGKDYPLSRTLSTLGLSVMDWHGDLAIGGNLQSQFMVGKTMLVTRANLNNRGAGQLSIRASSSEQLQMVLIGIIPILRSLINFQFGATQPSQ
ncbi:unnamed protein product [Sphagnum jensenii]|uniref:ATP-dependent 6-phosphofructokinase n=1 Tax=Sphagnum jensenii TaxID=128206 RepID=A0ABP1A7Q5_9BRYO